MHPPTLLRQGALSLALLCASALAIADPSPTPLPAPQSMAETGDWYGLLRRNVGTMLERRMEGVTSEAAVKNLDLSKWTTETVALCAAALNATKPSNPSGVAACWNIPVLLRESGVFVADLRMFRVGDASGAWANANIDTYNVSVEYQGSAAIQSRKLTAKELVAADEGMKGFELPKLMDAQFIGTMEKTMVAANLPAYVPAGHPQART